MGSTTACVGVMDASGIVRVINLGDSGFTWLRRQPVPPRESDLGASSSPQEVYVRV